MKAGIIAAGEGERFREKGCAVPKPLIPVGGIPLIERTLRAFESVGIDEVLFILRGDAQEVAQYLQKCRFHLRWSAEFRTTETSFETFYYLIQGLREGPYLISTVDLVYDPAELKTFLKRAASYSRDALVLGTTRFVHDEKPLWASVDKSQKVVTLGPKAQPTPWVTAGLYWGSEETFSTFLTAGPKGFSALREGLSALVEGGVPTYAVPMETVVDIDTPADIRIAEEMPKRSEKGET